MTRAGQTVHAMPTGHPRRRVTEYGKKYSSARGERLTVRAGPLSRDSSWKAWAVSLDRPPTSLGGLLTPVRTTRRNHHERNHITAAKHSTPGQEYRDTTIA